MTWTQRDPSKIRKGLPTVRDFMDTDIHALTPEMSVLDAIDFLLKHDISGAPVISSDDASLVGLLSEKDCLKLITKGRVEDADMPRGTVADYMTPKVMTVPPRMDIYYAAGLFLAEVYHRFPVTENGRVVGMISRRDILRAVREFLP